MVTLLWAPLALSTRHTRVQNTGSTGQASAGRVTGSLWRDRLAWQVTVFMGSQSAMAYIVMADCEPILREPILRERGLESAAAGYVVATAVVSQLVTSLITPSIAARCKDQRALAVGVALLVCTSLLVLMLGPLGVRWFWAVLLGCGLGSGFALALTRSCCKP